MRKELEERAETERAVLLAREHAARAAAEAAQARLAFLAEASTRLASSLDLGTTLDTLVKLAVPYLADWCFIDSRTEEGRVQRLALAFADPSMAKLAEDLRHREPDRTSRYGIHAVLRTGEALLVEDVDAVGPEIEASPEHARLTRELNPVSYMIVPLVSGRQTLGAITFISCDAARRYDASDVFLAEDLARRAAAAIENARLYQERSNVARTLQRSLLPPHLPRIPNVELAARYEPAEGLDVGGDFYDAFACGRRRWGIAIGDVCGKGAHAAALTGLARHTIRAAAIHRREPSRVLEVLNDAIVNERVGERFATVAFGFLEPKEDGLEFRIACGGHPPPLLLRIDGTVVPVGRPGTLLGLFDDVELAEDAVLLHPGDALVFYTDGVTESRRDGRVLGQAGLSRIVTACAGMNASHCAERVQEGAAEYRRRRARDDTAVLVLRVLAPQAPLPKRPTIDVRLPGGVHAPGEARRALSVMTEELSPDQLDDLTFLVNELVTNAIKHARVPDTGHVHLKLFMSPDLVRVEVTDPGSESEPQLRSPGLEGGSGWGLYLVNRIADRWGAETNGETRVWFELDRGG